MLAVACSQHIGWISINYCTGKLIGHCFACKLGKFNARSLHLELKLSLRNELSQLFLNFFVGWLRLFLVIVKNQVIFDKVKVYGRVVLDGLKSLRRFNFYWRLGCRLKLFLHIGIFDQYIYFLPLVDHFSSWQLLVGRLLNCLFI